MARAAVRLERRTQLHSEVVEVDWAKCSDSPNFLVQHDVFEPHLSQTLEFGDEMEIRIQVPGKELGGLDRSPLRSKYALYGTDGEGRLLGRLDMTNVHHYMMKTKAYHLEIMARDVLQVWSSDRPNWFVLGLVTPPCAVCCGETASTGKVVRCMVCGRSFHQACAKRKTRPFTCASCKELEQHTAPQQRQQRSQGQRESPQKLRQQHQLQHRKHKGRSPEPRPEQRDSQQQRLHQTQPSEQTSQGQQGAEEDSSEEEDSDGVPVVMLQQTATRRRIRKRRAREGSGENQQHLGRLNGMAGLDADAGGGGGSSHHSEERQAPKLPRTQTTGAAAGTAPGKRQRGGAGSGESALPLHDTVEAGKGRKQRRQGNEKAAFNKTTAEEVLGSDSESDHEDAAEERQHGGLAVRQQPPTVRPQGAAAARGEVEEDEREQAFQEPHEGDSDGMRPLALLADVAAEAQPPEQRPQPHQQRQGEELRSETGDEGDGPISEGGGGDSGETAAGAVSPATDLPSDDHDNGGDDPDPSVEAGCRGNDAPGHVSAEAPTAVAHVAGTSAVAAEAAAAGGASIAGADQATDRADGLAGTAGGDGSCGNAGVGQHQGGQAFTPADGSTAAGIAPAVTAGNAARGAGAAAGGAELHEATRRDGHTGSTAAAAAPAPSIPHAGLPVGRLVLGGSSGDGGGASGTRVNSAPIRQSLGTGGPRAPAFNSGGRGTGAAVASGAAAAPPARGPGPRAGPAAPQSPPPAGRQLAGGGVSAAARASGAGLAVASSPAAARRTAVQAAASGAAAAATAAAAPEELHEDERDDHHHGDGSDDGDDAPGTSSGDDGDGHGAANADDDGNVEGADTHLTALLREFPLVPSGAGPLAAAAGCSRRPSAALQAPVSLPAGTPEFLRSTYADIRQTLERGIEAESASARKLRQAAVCWQRLVGLYCKQKARLGRRCAELQRMQEGQARQLEQYRLQLRRQADEMRALQAASAAAAQARDRSQEEEAQQRQLVSELRQQARLLAAERQALEVRAAATEQDLRRLQDQLAAAQQQLQQAQDAARRQRQELQELQQQETEGALQQQQLLHQQGEEARRRHAHELEDARRRHEQELEDARRRHEQELQLQADEAARRHQDLQRQLEEARRQRQQQTTDQAWEQQLDEARREAASLRAQLTAALQGGPASRGGPGGGSGAGGGGGGGSAFSDMPLAYGAAGHGHGLRAEASDPRDDQIYIEQLEATAARLRADVMRQMTERVDERRALEAEVERWRQLARRAPVRSSPERPAHASFHQHQPQLQPLPQSCFAPSTGRDPASRLGQGQGHAFTPVTTEFAGGGGGGGPGTDGAGGSRPHQYQSRYTSPPLQGGGHRSFYHSAPQNNELSFDHRVAPLQTSQHQQQYVRQEPQPHPLSQPSTQPPIMQE